MDSPQGYHYLVALVHKLSDKIDGLERKIDRLVGKGTGQGIGQGMSQGMGPGGFPVVPPPVAFLEWVDSFVVSSTNLEVICQEHILEGFKHCLLENCRQGVPPLLVKGRSRQLYVFEVFPDETEAQWQPFTDDHLDHLIQEVWRKILERFLSDTELFAEEDERVQNYRDMCMKKILEMRKLLALRHRKEITRCLVTASRDKNIL
jgi:hypothetical protein